LDDVDSPAQFGLPLNVERSVQRAKSGAVISQLKKLARSMALLGGSGNAGKFNREQWRTDLGPVIELWDRLTKSSRDVLSRPKRGDGERGENKANGKYKYFLLALVCLCACACLCLWY
jgi:hypothetical protein